MRSISSTNIVNQLVSKLRVESGAAVYKNRNALTSSNGSPLADLSVGGYKKHTQDRTVGFRNYDPRSDEDIGSK